MTEGLVKEYGGWIAAGFMFLGALAKYYYDYKKAISKDEANVKLNAHDYEVVSRKELERQHEEVLKKLNQVEEEMRQISVEMEKIIAVMGVIKPLIDQVIKEKPEYKEMLVKAFEVIDNKAKNQRHDKK